MLHALLTVVLVFVTCTEAETAIHDERQALLQLWQNNAESLDWSDTTQHCFWPHIICNNDGRVTHLNVENLALTGSLPSLHAFSQLTSLKLSTNSLEAPSLGSLGLWGLAKLGLVDLTGNRIGGTVTGLKVQTPQLHTLLLDNNLLSGRLPNLAGAPLLIELGLAENYLSGPLINYTATNPQLTTLRLKQRAGYHFACPLSVPSLAIDLNAAENSCSTCDLAPERSHAISADNVGVTIPPTPNVGGSASYACVTGFATTTGATAYEMTCLAASTYQCANASCTCLPAGCDGVGGSAKVIDRCGDCGGNAQRCRPAVVEGVLLLAHVTLDQYVAVENDVKASIMGLLNESTLAVDNITLTATVASSGNSSAVRLAYSIRTVKEHGENILASLKALDQAALQGLLDAFLPGVEVSTTAAPSMSLTDEPQERSSGDSFPVLLVAAGAGGGVAFVLLLVLLCCCRRHACCSKEKRQRKKEWKTVLRESKRERGTQKKTTLASFSSLTSTATTSALLTQRGHSRYAVETSTDSPFPIMTLNLDNGASDSDKLGPSRGHSMREGAVRNPLFNLDEKCVCPQD